MPSTEEIREKVRDFIAPNVNQGGDLRDDTNLLLVGVAVDFEWMQRLWMKLQVFLEGEFEFHMEGTDFTEENLGTIHRIVKFVERKLESA